MSILQLTKFCGCRYNGKAGQHCASILATFVPSLLAAALVFCCYLCMLICCRFLAPLLPVNKRQEPLFITDDPPEVPKLCVEHIHIFFRLPAHTWPILFAAPLYHDRLSFPSRGCCSAAAPTSKRSLAFRCSPILLHNSWPKCTASTRIIRAWGGWSHLVEGP